jgi:hypothetical protein
MLVFKNTTLCFFWLFIVQVDLMMSGKRPVQAMSYIRDLGLFYVVFAFPEKSNPPSFYKCDWWVLTSSLYTVLILLSLRNPTLQAFTSVIGGF